MLLRSVLPALAFSLCLWLPIQAQNFFQKEKFYVGVSCGLTHDFQRAPRISAAYRRSNPYKIGIDVKFNLSKRVSLCSGLMLLGQGLSIYGEDATSFQRVEYKVYDIQVPLSVDIRLSGKKITPLLTTGIITDFYQHYKISNEFKDYSQPGYNFNTSGTYHESNVTCFFRLGFGAEATIKRMKLQAFPLLEMAIDKEALSYKQVLVGFMAALSYRL